MATSGAHDTGPDVPARERPAGWDPSAAGDAADAPGRGRPAGGDQPGPGLETDARGAEARRDPGVRPHPRVDARARLTSVLRTSFVLRGVALWFAVHLAMAFFGSMGQADAFLSPPQVVFLLVVVYAGVAADQRVRGEDVFLGNAGVAPWVGPVWAVGAAAGLEAVLQAVAAGMVR